MLSTLVSEYPAPRMKLLMLLDIVTEPPPVRLTLPLSCTLALLVTALMAIVPLLVIVPWRKIVSPLPTVTVLPVLMVTPLSVPEVPGWDVMTPPFWVVSVPPLTVASPAPGRPRMTVEPGPSARIVPLALLTSLLPLEHPAAACLERAGVVHGRDRDQQAAGLVGVDRPLVDEVVQAVDLAGALDRIVDVGQRGAQPPVIEFWMLLDIVTVPPPVSVTAPLMCSVVLWPVEFRAIVPLLVIVFWSEDLWPSPTVTVLPVLIVTPLSVAEVPAWDVMTPPFWVVSVPPLTVAAPHRTGPE